MSFKEIVTDDGIFAPSKEEIKQSILQIADSKGITIKSYSKDDIVADFFTETVEEFLGTFLQVHENNNLLSANGTALDVIAFIRAEKRKDEKKSLGIAKLTMVANNTAHIFAAGDLKLSTNSGLHFSNIQSFELLAGTTEQVEVEIQAEVVGTESNVPIDTITTITADPSQQISSVTNQATTGGRLKETDAELRKRLLEKSTTPLSERRLESKLDSLEWVRQAKVFRNNTDANNKHGVPIGQTSITIDDGTSTNELSNIRKKEVWELIRSNSWVNNWFKSDNSILLSFSENGTQTDYYIEKAKYLPIEIRIDIKKDNSQKEDNLKADILSLLNSHLASLKTGAKLTEFNLEPIFINHYYFDNTIQGIDTRVRLKADGVGLVDGWTDAHYELFLKYDTKTTLALDGIYITLNGVAY